MNTRRDADVVIEVFQAIERRELELLPDLYHPDIEFRWPPGLPHSGDFKGDAVRAASERFEATWMPLQPTEETRQMNVASGHEFRWTRHCPLHVESPGCQGSQIETDTMGDYQVRDGRLVRAQMFYYDLPGMISFLEQATEQRRTRWFLALCPRPRRRVMGPTWLH